MQGPRIENRRKFAPIAATLVASAMILTAPRPSAGQDSAGADHAARQLPAEGVMFHVEYDGLKNHADAWSKTAAYRILNETSTGAMLESVFTQVYGHYAPAKLSAPEALKLVKHAANHGFIISMALKQKAQLEVSTRVVLREAYSNKEILPIVARLLNALPAAGTKPQSVVKSGHKVVLIKPNPMEFFYWWVEEKRKEDLMILYTPIEGAIDSAFDSVDGGKPSMVDHPVRASLKKKEKEFQPLGMLFFDPKIALVTMPGMGMAKFVEASGWEQLDYRWGFDGPALMTVARVKVDRAKTQIPNLSGLFPGFDRSALPPGLQSAASFLAFSLKGKELGKIIQDAPATAQAYQKWEALLRDQARVKLGDDVLAQLGPKFAIFNAKADAKPAAGALSLPGGMAMLGSLIPGGASVPKSAIVVDIVDPAAFAKTLDGLMNFTNKSLKGMFTPPTPPAGPNDPPPPRSARNRGNNGPVPEFRLVTTDAKSYVLSIPPEMASQIPPGFRPTIRLAGKQLAIGTSAEVARQALETKGSYAPPSSIAQAFDQLPSKVQGLMVFDPSETNATVLAGLPGKLQAGINAIAAANASSGPKSDDVTVGFFDVPKKDDETRPMPGGNRPKFVSAAPSGGGPAPGGGPGGEAKPAEGEAGKPGGPLIIQVDNAKLPDASTLKGMMFPSIVEVDDDGSYFRIITRQAFPSLPDPAAVGVGYQMGKTMGTQMRNGGAPINPIVPPAGSANPNQRGGGMKVEQP